MLVSLQRLLPQHLISRTFGALARTRRPWLKQLLIRTFNAIYPVDLAEAERTSIHQYESFNDFFTRALADGRRPLPEDPNAFVSPADGAVSQLGAVAAGMLLQAKGIRYSLADLLGDAALAAHFEGGRFTTVYLGPPDYHRVHAPYAGVLRRSRAIPGALFSVNGTTEAGIEGLFCRNERLVLEFETERGPLALVMVGALIVASIETPFGTPASPFAARCETAHAASVQRGGEIGRFLVGSTVIVVWPAGVAELRDDLRPGTRVRVGEPIATITRARGETP
jgi:phosphatidylserine decarboxylase